MRFPVHDPQTLPADQDGSTVNKGVLAVVVVFFGFWMFKDPDGLAHFTQTSADALWGWTQQLFTSVIEYVGKL